MPWSQEVFTEDEIRGTWRVWVIAAEDKIRGIWVCVLKMFESETDSNHWVMGREFSTSRECLYWLKTETGRIFD